MADGTVTIDIKADGGDKVVKSIQDIDRAATKLGTGKKGDISEDLDKTGASAGKAQGGFKRLMQSFTGLSSSGEKTGGVLSSFREKLSFGAIAGAAQSAVTGLIGGIGDLVKEAVGANDAIDKFKSTMEFAGFGKKEIANATADMKKYADDTVYDLNTVLNTSAQLGANGVKNFTGLTKAAGNLNAVAGGNADTFKSVAMVLTQTAGAGKLTTENWNQLTDAIPGASGVLQTALKKNGAYTGNFRDAMADGQITADEFNKAILELGNNPGAIKAATSTKTFEGAIGNMEAAAVSGIQKIIDGFNKFSTALTGLSIPEILAKIGDVLGSALGGIGDAVGLAAKAIAPFGKQLQNMAQIVGTAIGMIKSYITGSFGAFDSFRNKLVKLVGSDAAGAITANIAKIAGPIGDFVQIIKGIAGVLTGGITSFKQFGSVIPETIGGGTLKTLYSFATNMKQFVSGLDLGKIAMGAAVPALLLLGKRLLGAGSGATGLITKFNPLAGILAKIVPSFLTFGGAATKTGATTSLLSKAMSGLSSGFSTVSGILGSGLVSGLSSLLSPLTRLMTQSSVGAKLVPLLGRAFAGISGPIGIILTAIIGLTTVMGAAGLAGKMQQLVGIVTTFAASFEAAAPQVGLAVGQIINGILVAIAAAIPQIAAGAGTLILSFTTAILAQTPTLILAATQLITSFTTTVVALAPQVIASFTMIVTSILDALAVALPQLIQAGTNLVVSFIQGLTASIPQVVPAAMQMIAAWLQAVASNMAQVVSAGMELLIQFLAGVASKIGGVTEKAIEIIVNFVNAIAGKMGDIVGAAVNLMAKFIQGLADHVADIINPAVDLIVKFVGAIANNLGKIINAAVDLISKFIMGLAKAIPKIADNALEAVMTFVEGVGYALGRVLTSGGELISRFVQGIINGMNKSRDSGKKNSNAVIDGIKAIGKGLWNAGVDLIKGFIGGIGSMIHGVWDAAVNIGKKAVDGVKSMLKIGSPSRVMRQVGVWTGQGFTDGMKDMLPNVSAMADKMANAATFATPQMSLGGLTGSLGHFTTAEQLLGGRLGALPSSQTINNYTTTNQTQQVVEQVASRPITVVSQIDGTEVARATVKPMDEQLGRHWDDQSRKMNK